MKNRFDSLEYNRSIVTNSIWADRTFKSLEELRKLSDKPEQDDWRHYIPKGTFGLIYNESIVSLCNNLYSFGNVVPYGNSIAMSFLCTYQANYEKAGQTPSGDDQKNFDSRYCEEMFKKQTYIALNEITPDRIYSERETLNEYAINSKWKDRRFKNLGFAHTYYNYRDGTAMYELFRRVNSFYFSSEFNAFQVWATYSDIRDIFKEGWSNLKGKAETYQQCFDAIFEENMFEPANFESLEVTFKMVDSGFYDNAWPKLIANSKWKDQIFLDRRNLAKVFPALSENTSFSGIFGGQSFKEAFNALTSVSKLVLLKQGYHNSPKPSDIQTVFDNIFKENMFTVDEYKYDPSKEWVPYNIMQPKSEGDYYTCTHDEGPNDTVVRTYKDWISHPGGDSRANAGPGFIDELGHPMSDEIEYWREITEEFELELETKRTPLSSIKSTNNAEFLPYVADNATINSTFGITQPLKNEPSSDLDDDYYATIN